MVVGIVAGEGSTGVITSTKNRKPTSNLEVEQGSTLKAYTSDMLPSARLDQLPNSVEMPEHKGTLLVQTTKDRISWVTDGIENAILD